MLLVTRATRHCMIGGFRTVICALSFDLFGGLRAIVFTWCHTEQVLEGEPALLLWWCGLPNLDIIIDVLTFLVGDYLRLKRQLLVVAKV